jgi:hypothetical protein
VPAAPADEAANTDPSAWAAESLALAKKDVYKTPIGPGLKPAASTKPKAASTAAKAKPTTSTTTSTAYVMTTAYYNTALQDAKERIALAGARLAYLLNNNLK